MVDTENVEVRPSTMFIGLLEDNAGVSEFLATFLTLVGHTFELHCTAESLLESPQRYDVIVVDLRLDGDLTGVEVIERMREKQPDLPVIVASAYNERDIQAAIQGLPDVRYICKPFRPSALGTLLKEATKGRITQV